jgi:hypothetical protein
MDWLFKFPQLSDETLLSFKKSVDGSFRAFTRSYGDSIEAAFAPLQSALIFFENLITGTPWPIIVLVIGVFAWFASRNWAVVAAAVRYRYAEHSRSPSQCSLSLHRNMSRLRSRRGRASRRRRGYPSRHNQGRRSRSEMCERSPLRSKSRISALRIGWEDHHLHDWDHLKRILPARQLPARGPRPPRNQLGRRHPTQGQPLRPRLARPR